MRRAFSLLILRSINSASTIMSAPARRSRSSGMAVTAQGDTVPRTPDGHHVVIDGRKWRASDPSLTPEVRQQHVNELMSARRAVGAAMRTKDAAAEKAARARVHAAKVALGERGAKWWEKDGANAEAKDADGAGDDDANMDDSAAGEQDDSAASSSAAAASAPTANLFTPLRTAASVASERPRRKRGAKAELEPDDAAAEADEDVKQGKKAPAKTKVKAAAAKRQKTKAADLSEAAAATTTSSPSAAAAASSSSAAAAASAAPAAAAFAAPSSTDGIHRASPSVLSFPASLLKQPLSAYGPAFDSIARDFLFNYELHCNGHILRVLEMEFYWRSADDASHPDGAGHVDLFAHASPVQHSNFGRWYWHRQGTKPDASYKGGNYKGLDVTCGPVGGTGHGGILIRSIQRVSDGVCIEGSCLVAEEVLRLHKASSIEEVVSRWGGNTCAFSNATLFFAPAKHKLPPVGRGQPILVRSPRVGLTLKQSGPSRPRFIMLPYRYCRLDIPGFVNRKQKQTILCSAYEELGLAGEDAIRKMCGCNASYFATHTAAFDSGKKLAGGMAKFVGSKNIPSAEEMSQMYGAWMKEFGGKHTAFLRAE